MSYIGNPIVSTDFPVDYASGNGSTTAFTLSVAPASVNSIDVQISGVSQSPQTYSVSGTTLTFSAAPPTGTNNIVIRHLGIAGIPNVPAVGSVTPALLSTANAVYWDGSGNVGMGTSSPTAKLQVTGHSSNIGATFDKGATNQYGINYKNSSQTYTQYVDINNNGTNWWSLYDTTNSSLVDVYVPGASAYRAFYTVGTERMRIDSSGNVLVGTTTNSFGGLANARTTITPVANNNGVMVNNLSSLYIALGTKPNGAHSYFAGYFLNSSDANVGNIQVSTTATQYNTSSDYRLKENIAPMTGALNKVAALKPVTYTWKSNGEQCEGFIAHELAEVIPACVTGEKDAVNAEGKPVYQGIDTSFLVATLTAAIQELKAQVEAQALEIQALKGTV